jgi:hypothetical protein
MMLAQGMQVVSNGFFLGQIFITWQQKEWSATHTKYLCESIFVPPKMPQSCQNLRNNFSEIAILQTNSVQKFAKI